MSTAATKGSIDMRKQQTFFVDTRKQKTFSMHMRKQQTITATVR
jgi:hypothetical protein